MASGTLLYNTKAEIRCKEKAEHRYRESQTKPENRVEAEYRYTVKAEYRYSGNPLYEKKSGTPLLICRSHAESFLRSRIFHR